MSFYNVLLQCLALPEEQRRLQEQLQEEGARWEQRHSRPPGEREKIVRRPPGTTFHWRNFSLAQIFTGESFQWRHA